MATLPYTPLLITSRPELAQLVADCAPEVPITVHSADTVPGRVWASAPAILIDAQAAGAVGERAFPTLPHTCLITDAHPEPQTWTDAVKLGVRWVVELPEAERWLAQLLNAAARGPAVVAVVGPGDGGTNIATTVAAALAVEAMAHGQTAALIGIRPDSRPLEHRVRPGLPITERPPTTRDGRLDLVTRTHQAARPEDVASAVANLRDDHDLIVIDAAAPSCAAGMAAIDEAHLILVVATPAELDIPAMRDLQRSLERVADRVRLLIPTAGVGDDERTEITTTTAPGFARAYGIEITMPPDEPGLVSDSAFRRACAEAARLEERGPCPAGDHHPTARKDDRDVRVRR